MPRPNLPARVLFALGSMLFVSPVLVALASPAPLERVTLGNGLRVVLAPDSMAGGVDVAIWHPVGVRDERPGKTGLTHLVERLAYRGSASVKDGEHRERVLAEGGTLNTSASADHVCFWQTVPSEALAVTLALEADRLAGLAPTPTAFESEQRAALLARAGGERSPVARGLARLWAEAFAGHPYARASAGIESDLRTLTLADAVRWRRERFTAGTAVLTVVGRFEPVATLARIRETFGRLPRGSRPPAPLASAMPSGTRRGEESVEAPVRVLFAGWRGPGASDADVPAMALLAQHLGAGESPKLMRLLAQEWSLALAAEAGFEVRDRASLFWVLAAVRDDADSTTAERVLRDEMGRIAREGVTDAELQRAKRLAEARARFAMQGVRARAQALGEAELTLGDASLADRTLTAWESLTAADLQRAARRLFEAGPSAIVWANPVASRGAR